MLGGELRERSHGLGVAHVDRRAMDAVAVLSLEQVNYLADPATRDLTILATSQMPSSNSSFKLRLMTLRAHYPS